MARNIDDALTENLMVLEVATAALDVAVGASLLLDAQLCVMASTEGARALLGGEVPKGVSAAALLCGDRKKRPIADALAEGRAVEAIIPRADDRSRLLKVRSLPLRRANRKPYAWLLVLEDAGDADASDVVFHGMVSNDPAMKQLFRFIERIADDDSTVLIRGESGTGKELVAQAIHAASPRAREAFQAINCAALPSTLLEAELFGTVRGAFTGALKDTPGLIRSAHKGTLFLDEVADLPLELQAKLLRVLETRQVLPVGGTQAKAVDVRVLSATHRALRKEVEEGRFRADLMYRLRVIPLFLPPLRERSGDIALLARRFVDELNAKSRRRRIETIAVEALEVLRQGAWPGNVRELKNALQYAFAVGEGPVLRSVDLPPELLLGRVIDGDDDAKPTSGEPMTRARVERALAAAGGRRDEAAALLGVSRVTLWRWMRELRISIHARKKR
jgi:transcriptional regulator with PAS, ATPase and Fis domain